MFELSPSGCGMPPRGTRAYGVPAAQGPVLVTVMSCPRHLSAPAAHSLIVCSTPPTATHTRKPPSSHSEASLQTHLLLGAGNRNDGGLTPRGGGGRVKAHDLQNQDALGRSLEAPASGRQPTPLGKQLDRESEAFCSTQNKQSLRLVRAIGQTHVGQLSPSQGLPKFSAALCCCLGKPETE